ncbi:MAG: hypothetical protein PX481_07300, partial [Microcystis sp. M53603_WE2]|uniref:hypothetical protein n=1 Tax=Microcystis sp. M53603_WE2 TaxID=3030678 RepID=UPI002590B9A7
RNLWGRNTARLPEVLLFHSLIGSKSAIKSGFTRSLVFSEFIPSRSVAAYQEQQVKIFAEETAQEKCNSS